MANEDIRTALSPSAGIGIQTTKLADNLQSMKNAEDMLSNTVQIVNNSPKPIQQKLMPLLSQFVLPLLSMSTTARQDLEIVTQRMRAFISDLAQVAECLQGQTDSQLVLTLKGNLSFLEVDATAVQAAATNSSQILTNLQNHANRASAALNTYKQNLLQQNVNLEQKEKNLEQKIHDMEDGNCCEQIGHAFQTVFGHLRDELNKAKKGIWNAEHELMLNNKSIAGLSQMISRLGDISSVASALEVSWRSMADGVGTLQDEIESLVADTTPANIESDFEYAKSDWQAVSNTLSKVS